MLWAKVVMIGAISGTLAGGSVGWLLTAFCTGNAISDTETAVIGVIAIATGITIGALFAAGSVIGDMFCYAALHGSD